MAECKHLISPPGDCGTCYPPAGRPPSPQLWGPWFTASYNSDCAGCGNGIFPHDEIRADGDGGYLCSDCGDDSQAFIPSGCSPPRVPVAGPDQGELRRRFQEGYT